MKIEGKHYRTIWPLEDGKTVEIIDQTKLPHALITVRLSSADHVADAIRNMTVRGAPLIGVTAAYGVALAMRENASDEALDAVVKDLGHTRPTAVNLHWALQHMCNVLRNQKREKRAELAWKEAAKLADQDVETCRSIGANGLPIFRDLYEAKQQAGRKGPLNVLTHCNAGWLGCVDWGTALAPLYMAHDEGIPLHVWVDETRPRNQGASLTAFELSGHGVPHAVIADNAGGHFMREGAVDACIVGCDRVTANGDVANKIGTYLKALAARDNDIPFFVALPSSTIDWNMESGDLIPIEERSQDEVRMVTGLGPDGRLTSVTVTPMASPAANPGFDVTPARLVTKFITEKGVCSANEPGLRALFPKW